jgi:hypothetical protein
VIQAAIQAIAVTQVEVILEVEISKEMILAMTSELNWSGDEYTHSLFSFFLFSSLKLAACRTAKACICFALYFFLLMAGCIRTRRLF